MTEGRNDGQAENSIHPKTTFCRGLSMIKEGHQFLRS